MAKKFVKPVVLLSSAPGDDVVIGGGTGQSTPDVYACSYDDWLILFANEAYDWDGDGEYSYEEYEGWCEDNGFDPIP